jgi:phage terminase large subunit-like protein
MPRDDLVELLATCRDTRNRWLRYQIIQNRRTDILAEAILGYQVIPTVHFPIIRHQAIHPQSLVLAFRGAGKTTTGTIADAILSVLIDPNVRILLASKTLQNAQDFLKEIKGHFEHNDRLREVFGDYVGKGQWDERSIEVAKRTEHRKEPTIMTVGADGAVASKHYDIIYPDDLVEEENSRTEHMRNRLRDWFYKVLMPCLEPPEAGNPLRGGLRMGGTRYHPEDLYGYVMAREMKGKTLIIPALDEAGASTWPAKFPAEFFEQKRENHGTIIFNAQYQCDCEAMKGEIFQYEDCHRHPDKDFPNEHEMRVYQGVDLAIGEREANDKFAQVVIGITADDHIWVLDYEEGRFRFNKQTERILKLYDKWKPVWCGVESNAYQAAQLHNLKDRDPNFRGLKIQTTKDKRTRAWKLTPHFEAGRVHFRQSAHLLIERLVSFGPSYRYKDLFDAFDLAVQASARRKAKRRKAVGLI